MITFSGIDCAGKSTQIEYVKQLMNNRGVNYSVIWSRGGYTSWVEALKNLFRKKTKGAFAEEKSFSEKQKEAVIGCSKKAKLLLWVSILDLIRYYGIVFRCIEKKGTLIICDRYIWDTYVDFCMKYSGVDFENWLVWKILLIMMKKPDCSIIFTIPVEESLRRSELKEDLHSEPTEMREKRIYYYEKLIKTGKWDSVIDATYDIQKVSECVKRTLIEWKVTGFNYEENKH